MEDRTIPITEMAEEIPQRRGKIGPRLFRITMGLVLGQILLAVLLLLIARGLLEQEAKTTVQQLAAHVSSRAEESVLEAAYTSLLTISASPTLRSEQATVGAKYTELEYWERTYGIFRTLELLDLEGNIITGTGGRTRNLASEEWFVRASRGQTVVSDAYFWQLGTQPVITFAVPLYDMSAARSEVVGVVAGHISVEALTEQVAAVKLGQAGHAFIVDGQGRVIAGKDAPGLLDVSDTEAVQTALAADRPGNTIGPAYDGPTRMLYGYAPLIASEDLPFQLDWAALTVRPMAEVESGFNTLLLVVVTIAFVTLAVSISLSVEFARQIRQPIEMLQSSALRISQGDLDAPLLVEQAEDEVVDLSETLATMVANLRTALARIQNSERVLIATAAISRRATSARQVDDLLLEAVELIRSTFGYYHVHAYLAERDSGMLFMRAGSGAIGQELKAKGHCLMPGQGIVGRVASSGQPFLAADTGQVEFWAPNPLLPNTRAELAVPIRSARGEVIGVLDAQSETVGGFAVEDQELLRSLADQLAVAIENWELSNAQQRAYERQRVLNIIYQQIQRATSLDEVLQTTARELGTALSAESTSVYVSLGQDGEPDNGS